MINKGYEHIIGVEDSLKSSYFTTVLHQEGLYHKFFKNISDAVQSGVKVFIWSSNIKEFEQFDDVFIITTSKSFINSHKNVKYKIANSEEFRISNIFEYQKVINFKIKRKIYCIYNPVFQQFGLSIDNKQKNIMNSGVGYFSLNKNKYILFPFDLEEEQIGIHNEYRDFFSKSVGLNYIEIGPSIDYYLLRDLIFNLLILAFNSIELPLIKLKRPFDDKNVYSIRVDADGFNEDDFNLALSLGLKLNKRFSWFIDLYSIGKYGGFKFLRKLKKSKQAIHIHSFRHIIYSSYLSNLINISIARIIMYLYRIKNLAIVSPFGFFNNYYHKAINNFRFEFTSDFGYNVLDLPSHPNNDFNTIMQIPSNNASVKTLLLSGFTVAESFEHLYHSTLELSRYNGFAVLYDHPSQGIAAYIENYEKLINDLDIHLRYVDIIEIKERYKSYYERLRIDNKLCLDFNHNDHLYYKKFYINLLNTEVIANNNEDLTVKSDTEKVRSLIQQRNEYYLNHFKKEYDCNIFQYFFRYLIPSFVIFNLGALIEISKSLFKKVDNDEHN